MDFLKYDLAIVGAGPAGLTAAIYARRANASVVFVDKAAPGGKVVTTAVVENYPGFESISGPDLALKFFEQAQKLKAKFIFSEVVEIDSNTDEYKYVYLANGKVIQAKAVIIATGMVNRKIGAANEDRLFDHGISYCAICDGALFRDKPVAVIGSGRSAVEESIYLSDIASHVTVISNKKEFKADQPQIELMMSKANIDVIMDSDTLSFNGQDKLESITLKNKTTGEESNLNVDGAFIFIGFLPISPSVNKESFLDPELKFLKVDSAMKTNIKGIFAAGDITSKNIRQISTAINDGTIAALSACEYITHNKWN
ncbi:NAD(P)/FAD-dependent oxidoreductase [Ureaplasma ceti]|uniref:Thioredoxin-disulfide reductase n=1 Tax=Ureaplasma ceti TaxID=3119530 RepID=A0ABP9UAP4_9BACT